MIFLSCSRKEPMIDTTREAILRDALSLKFCF